MYSTVPDVRSALTPDGDAYDYDTPAHYSNEQIIDAIQRADSQIDMYLRAAYTVPVAEPDALLKDWSSSIAAYLTVLVQANGADINQDDPIRLRYSRALDALKAVAAGQLVLPYPTDEASDLDDPHVINRTPGNMFLADEFLSPRSYNDPYLNSPFRRAADGTWERVD